jgi:hypothetical protein
LLVALKRKSIYSKVNDIIGTPNYWQRAKIKKGFFKLPTLATHYHLGHPTIPEPYSA